MSPVNQAMNHLRHQWLGLRVGGPGATMRGHWTILSVSIVVVFAGFFAIGRAARGGQASGSRAEAPAALQGSSGHAAIPDSLSGRSPIAGAVPVDIVPPRRPQPAKTQRATAPAREEPSRVQPTITQVTAAPAVQAAPTVQAAPQSTAAAPSPQPTHQAAPSRPASPAPARAQPSHGGGGEEGGASFDSSE
jgi:hypothetical protein